MGYNGMGYESDAERANEEWTVAQELAKSADEHRARTFAEPVEDFDAISARVAVINARMTAGWGIDTRTGMRVGAQVKVEITAGYSFDGMGNSVFRGKYAEGSDLGLVLLDVEASYVSAEWVPVGPRVFFPWARVYMLMPFVEDK